MLELPKGSDYDDTRAKFRLEIPEFYNFGFDLIAKRAREADKTAFIAVDRTGERIEQHSFSDLDRAANRFAHVLLELGAAKGDFAFAMIPRIPAWYQVLIGCIKTGVVAMPPSGPKEVRVSVEPDNWSALAVPSRAAAAKRPISAANCHIFLS